MCVNKARKEKEKQSKKRKREEWREIIKIGYILTSHALLYKEGAQSITKRNKTTLLFGLLGQLPSIGCCSSTLSFRPTAN